MVGSNPTSPPTFALTRAKVVPRSGGVAGEAEGSERLTFSRVPAWVRTCSWCVLARTAGGNVTLFAFDAGEELSEHTSPFDALVNVLEGTFVLTIAGQELRAEPAAAVRARGAELPTG